MRGTQQWGAAGGARGRCQQVPRSPGHSQSMLFGLGVFMAPRSGGVDLEARRAKGQHGSWQGAGG